MVTSSFHVHAQAYWAGGFLKMVSRDFDALNLLYGCMAAYGMGEH